jgi:hypothetical protein
LSLTAHLCNRWRLVIAADEKRGGPKQDQRHSRHGGVTVGLLRLLAGGAGKAGVDLLRLRVKLAACLA